ncbi:hypothetical protein [Saccharolobus sp.]|jgi:hypothetical protein|uniref:hypothetical protein n=1 Tax=Saccharolobus sp. TaxID=2100761 RepID=UPI00317CBD43
MQQLLNFLTTIINAFANYLANNFGITGKDAIELGGFIFAMLISTILLLIAAAAPIARRVAIFIILLVWILVVFAL